MAPPWKLYQGIQIEMLFGWIGYFKSNSILWHLIANKSNYWVLTFSLRAHFSLECLWPIDLCTHEYRWKNSLIHFTWPLYWHHHCDYIPSVFQVIRKIHHMHTAQCTATHIICSEFAYTWIFLSFIFYDCSRCCCCCCCVSTLLHYNLRTCFDKWIIPTWFGILFAHLCVFHEKANNVECSRDAYNI